jgi:hypothetical protein
MAYPCPDMLPETRVVDCQDLGSSTRGDQPRLVYRIVVHRPRRRQRLTEPEEVAQTRTIAATNSLVGYGVTAQTHAISHSCHGKVGVRQPEEYQVTVISGSDQPANSGSERSAREGRFEPETPPPSERGRARANTSASTNSETARTSMRSRPAIVDLPAPFGPARTTTEGRSPRMVAPYGRLR